jgi:hypothetical protein
MECGPHLRKIKSLWYVRHYSCLLRVLCLVSGPLLPFIFTELKCIQLPSKSSSEALTWRILKLISSPDLTLHPQCVGYTNNYGDGSLVYCHALHAAGHARELNAARWKTYTPMKSTYFPSAFFGMCTWP